MKEKKNKIIGVRVTTIQYEKLKQSQEGKFKSLGTLGHKLFSEFLMRSSKD
jgi:hypothetical protein